MSFKTKILILSALSLGLTTLFGVGVFAQSNYETFLKQLDLLKVTDQDFVQKSAITRYDLARIMNLVECKDCLNPEQKMIDRYDQDYWSVFLTLPGKDFLDIPFRGALAGNKSYYYCVAYVGDKSYMRGYPIATSPYCPGKFCGSNLTTKAEFLQVIFNILSNYAYNNYSVNRSNVKKRYDGLDKNSYQARTLDATDVQRIQQGVEQCAANTCLLTQSGSLRTYVKYCMFNLNACGFQEFGATKQGTRPVAELNVLLRQNILTIDEAVATKISDQVSADEAIRVLYRLQQQVKCSFNTDYDCDGVTNASDNCPNAFNPNQTDTDNDGI